MSTINRPKQNKQQQVNPLQPDDCKAEQKQVNTRGDAYAVNSAGQVTMFRYCDTNMTHFFAYDEKGNLTNISSSAGWTWTKTTSDGFASWVIRNYFDLWKVRAEDAGEVYVNHTGIHATGTNATLMALPEVGRG